MTNSSFSLRDLEYDLPEQLIAQRPLPDREDARLLLVGQGKDVHADSRVAHLPEWLLPGDLLVLNDTKVLPARFTARRATGGRVEGLFLEEDTVGFWQVMLKGARRVREGDVLELEARESVAGHPDDDSSEREPSGSAGGDVSARVAAQLGDGLWLLEMNSAETPLAILNRIGSTPLPPYIKRADSTTSDEQDRLRYQTVYASNPGAIAAPTAGLHLTDDLLARIRSRGVATALLTLHVGVGTFRPISVDRIDDHRMHVERYHIPAETERAVRACTERGGRVVAVGTTTVRALESAAIGEGFIRAGRHSTDIFIYPPYQFRVVDALLTNFHLPRSTLLAMVMAFAGIEQTRSAYAHAVHAGYRFFSYGDAMFIG